MNKLQLSQYELPTLKECYSENPESFDSAILSEASKFFEI
jgi:hypothetical protein